LITGAEYLAVLFVFVSLVSFLKIPVSMKKIFTYLLVCALAHSVHAQTSATDNTPDALGLKETAYDFGKIPQGKPVTHIFEVVNNGRDSLKISNVQASCGCTTPEWEREKTQAPGESTKITVGYNAAGEGSFTKTITVSYNGTQSKIITIKGEVWKTPMNSAPENKDLGNLKEL
jgi:hypothetical protein